MASRMGANFQSSKGVVFRVGMPAREGAASVFLYSLGVLSMAWARTLLIALCGAAGRAAERGAAWREIFIETAICLAWGEILWAGESEADKAVAISSDELEISRELLTAPRLGGRSDPGA